VNVAYMYIQQEQHTHLMHLMASFPGQPG